ncbi:hypothetical protein AGMMS50233_11260 [Endomicrobiia bacterium]|nr:hypothetical protein AGMMS50233_11260 [Endomicrobiia bacterium]
MFVSDYEIGDSVIVVGTGVAAEGFFGDTTENVDTVLGVGGGEVGDGGDVAG